MRLPRLLTRMWCRTCKKLPVMQAVVAKGFGWTGAKVTCPKHG